MKDKIAELINQYTSHPLGRSSNEAIASAILDLIVKELPEEHGLMPASNMDKIVCIGCDCVIENETCPYNQCLKDIKQSLLKG